MKHSTLKAEIEKEIQQDLDAGRFNLICSNETTFKRYVADHLSAAIDKATKSALEAVLPPFQERNGPEAHTSLEKIEAILKLARTNGFNDCRREMITKKDKYLSEI